MLARPKISICILTVNRADLLGATLESIMVQVTTDCEIVIVDCGSTDDTGSVVARYSKECSAIRYVRNDINQGMDRDRDEAVKHARGEYCWLLSSKDLLNEGAVESVLKVLHENVSAVIVNMEIWNHDLSRELVPSALALTRDTVYEIRNADSLFFDSFYAASHFSNVIIKREIWMGIDKTEHYGSQYIQLLALFARPLPQRAVVLSRPLLRHRFGRPGWLRNSTQMLLMWAPLLQSLELDQATKQKFLYSEVEKLRWILFFRACGGYSWTEYHSIARPQLSSLWIQVAWALAASVPRRVLNMIYVLCCKVFKYHYANLELELLRKSPFYFRK